METARVIEVTDGKSLMISPKWEHNGEFGHIIILEGVSAPTRSEVGGKEAKTANEKICNGKNIAYKGVEIDVHRRLIAQVEIGGVSVNETLNELGYRP